MSSLHQACASGNLAAVRQSISNGANVSEVRDDYRPRSGVHGDDPLNVWPVVNWTPLHIAVFNNHSDVVRELLDAGAETNTRDNGERTPLYYAAYYGRAEAIVTALVQAGADIDSEDTEKFTPLIRAVAKGHAHTVRTLLSLGASVNHQNWKQSASLHYACAANNVELTRLLLEHKANVDIAGHYARTPMIFAAEKNNRELLSVLIDAGGDADAKDFDQKNAANHATQSSVRQFLEDEVKHLRYARALFKAATQGDVSAVQNAIGSEWRVDDILKPERGRCVLMVACRAAQFDVVKLLLDTLGADVHAKDWDGATALHHACSAAVTSGQNSQACSIASELLRRSSDLATVADKNGRLPLHCACASGNSALVAILVDAYPKGCETKDSNGNLPLHEAGRCLCVEAMSELIQRFPDAARSKNNAAQLPWHVVLARERWQQNPDVARAVDMLVRSDLPVDDAGMTSSQHCYSWHRLLRDCEDCFESIVIAVLDDHITHVRVLAQSVDEQGRKAMDVATPKCRDILLKRLLFYGRYKLGKSLHKSKTCDVVVATEFRSDGSEVEVVLKMMRQRDQFDREVTMRKSNELSPEFVMPLLDCHDDEDFRKAADSHGYGPYGLVMPLADSSLADAILHDDFAGQFPDGTDKMRAIVRNICQGLQHLHSKGLLHGDVKPLNIVHVQLRWLLIDLDACVSFARGDDAGAKLTPAFVAPECVYLDPSGVASVRGTFGNIAMVLGAEPIKAQVSLDMWSLGVTCFELFSGRSLFHADYEGAITQSDLLTLAEWKDEVRDAKLAEIKDRKARNLVSRLLCKDPSKRLGSIDQVLSHAFMLGRNAPRLPGEAAQFDVFISYRVASDFSRAGALYRLLTAAGLRVWWDRECLEKGKPWEEGFFVGLVQSRVAVCLLSKGAFEPFETLTESSRCDNVLLEHTAMLELVDMGMLGLIFPIMVGPPKEEGVLGNFFDDPVRSVPQIEGDILVRANDEKLRSNLDAQGLGSPLGGPYTVKHVYQNIMKYQGCFLAGQEQECLQDIAVSIVEAVKGL